MNEEKQELLWTDGMIVARYYNAVHYPITPEQMAFVKRIRNDYEADRARTAAQLAAAQRRVAELEAEVKDWRQRHAECTTSLITADRKIERLRAQLAEASRLISLMHPVHGFDEGECEAQLASAQADAPPVVPPEVAETIEYALNTVLQNHRDGLIIEHPPKVLDRVNAALSWLDSVKGNDNDG